MGLSNRYKTFIKVSNTGAWEYEIRNGRIWYSSEYFEILGMKKPSRLNRNPKNIELYWKNLLHEDDRETAINNFNSFLKESNKKIYENYFRIRKVNGEYMWVLSRGIKVFDIFKKCKKIIGTHIDITDFKVLEKKIYNYQKNEQIGTLVRGISHDFRNVLSGIMGLIQIIEPKLGNNSDLEDIVKTIKIAAKRGLELTNQILTFSKPDENQLKEVLLSDTVGELVNFLKPVIPNNISLTYEIIEEFKISINPINIYQVILNLCTNAVKALEGGKGSIHIRISCVTLSTNFKDNFILLEKGSYLLLEVIDSGKGIEEGSIEKIFTSNFSTKVGDDKSGIGLSIVYSILSNNRAKITVESKVDKGTSFKIFFPRIE